VRCARIDFSKTTTATNSNWRERETVNTFEDILIPADAFIFLLDRPIQI